MSSHGVDLRPRTARKRNWHRRRACEVYRWSNRPVLVCRTMRNCGPTTTSKAALSEIAFVRGPTQSAPNQEPRWRLTAGLDRQRGHFVRRRPCSPARGFRSILIFERPASLDCLALSFSFAPILRRVLSVHLATTILPHCTSTSALAADQDKFQARPSYREVSFEGRFFQLPLRGDVAMNDAGASAGYVVCPAARRAEFGDAARAA